MQQRALHSKQSRGSILRIRKQAVDDAAIRLNGNINVDRSSDVKSHIMHICIGHAAGAGGHSRDVELGLIGSTSASSYQDLRQITTACCVTACLI